MISVVQQLPKLEVRFCVSFVLDIEIFLGDNNDLDQEEVDDEDDQIEEQDEIEHEMAMMEESKDAVAERVTSQLRYSHNGVPSVQPASVGLEGFGGIVGIGFAGKKAGGLPQKTGG